MGPSFRVSFWVAVQLLEKRREEDKEAQVMRKEADRKLTRT
jgi:hypothetical protein